jgi:hypothetical protein
MLAIVVTWWNGLSPEMRSGIIAALVGALAAGAVSVWQARRAHRRRREAEATMLLIELRAIEDVLWSTLHSPRILDAELVILTKAHEAISDHAELFRATTVRSVMAVLAKLRLLGRMRDQIRSGRTSRTERSEYFVKRETILALRRIGEEKAALEREGSDLPERVPDVESTYPELPPLPERSFPPLPDVQQ